MIKMPTTKTLLAAAMLATLGIQGPQPSAIAEEQAVVGHWCSDALMAV